MDLGHGGEPAARIVSIHLSDSDHAIDRHGDLEFLEERESLACSSLALSYLEAGLEKAKNLAIALLEEAYPKIDMDAIFRDHKTTLQELTQAHYGVTPEYRLVRSFGPDHKKEFEIAVSIKGNDLALASGKSKKEAQQKAAMIALEILKKEHR